MVLKTLASVRLLDVDLCAVTRDAQDFIIVLGLTSLERCLRLLQLALQRADLGVGGVAVCLRLLDCGLEVSD